MYWNIKSIFGFLAPWFSKFAQGKVCQLLQNIEYGCLTIVTSSKDGYKQSSLSGGKKNALEGEVTLTVNHENFWTRVFWNQDTVSIFPL